MAFPNPNIQTRLFLTKSTSDDEVKVAELGLVPKLGLLFALNGGKTTFASSQNLKTDLLLHYSQVVVCSNLQSPRYRVLICFLHTFNYPYTYS